MELKISRLAALQAIVTLLKIARDYADQMRVADLIERLTDSERVLVRQEARKQGVKEYPRNLYFNYETQRWIGGDDFKV